MIQRLIGPLNQLSTLLICIHLYCTPYETTFAGCHQLCWQLPMQHRAVSMRHAARMLSPIKCKRAAHAHAPKPCSCWLTSVIDAAIKAKVTCLNATSRSQGDNKQKKLDKQQMQLPHFLILYAGKLSPTPLHSSHVHSTTPHTPLITMPCHQAQRCPRAECHSTQVSGTHQPQQNPHTPPRNDQLQA